MQATRFVSRGGVILLVLMLGVLTGRSMARAQGNAGEHNSRSAHSGSVVAFNMAGTGAEIVADSPPYHLQWNGTSGTLARDAFGSDPEETMSLVYLHADTGPNGYSKHLAWFLARDTHRFALVWCYLNDTGREFYAWLYRFPENELTTIRFSGRYRFAPPTEPVPPALMEDFALQNAPVYTGPQFAFGDWTRRQGTLANLALRSAAAESSMAGGGPDTSHAPPASTAAPVKSLTQLRILPLHELHVAARNGWRTGGWHELHALAYDSAQDPYYLILYNNSTQGFVIDLKRGQTFITDFGAKVQFLDDTGSLSPDDLLPQMLPDVRVQRFERYDIPLKTSQKYDNPYTDVLLEADFRSEDGKRMVVPGFWDGGDTWRIRFAPARVGLYTWRVRCNDPELNGQAGTLECVADDADTEPVRGFVGVRPSATYQRHFAYSDGSPFYPAMLRDPVFSFPPATSVAGNGGVILTGQEKASGAPVSPSADVATDPPSFVAFQKRMDAYAALGFNRLIGAYLLDKPLLAGKSQVNEGGSAFVGGDLDHPNPLYFQWMEKRLAYCNEKGLVPDIGLGWPDQGLFTTYTDTQLRQIWRYMLARFSAYDVCWNLFGRDDAPTPPGTDSDIRDYIDLTRKYDPYQHPLTTMSLGASTAPADSASLAPAAGSDLGAEHQGAIGGGLPPANRRRNSLYTALDVITQLGGDLKALPALQDENKPIIVEERPTFVGVAAAAEGDKAGDSASVPAGPMSPDVARQRLWETRMQGAYWAGGISPASAGLSALDSPEVQGAAACARFFRITQFWRLDPHQDMLGGPEESPFEIRRRKQAERDAAEQALAHPAPVNAAPALSAARPPIFVLADPAWEYVIYFEQGRAITLDLLEATGKLKLLWFNPRTGQFTDAQGNPGKSVDALTDRVEGGDYRTFTAPDANDWVLYLSRRG